MTKQPKPKQGEGTLTLKQLEKAFKAAKKKFHDCQCKVCGKVYLDTPFSLEELLAQERSSAIRETVEAIRKQLAMDLELWFDRHDRKNKPFKSNDLITYLDELLKENDK